MDDRKKPPQNETCSLLSSEENERLFSVIGSKCYSLAAAVVQVFHTEPPSHSRWVKRHCGVACFIKDYFRKSYFIRIIDIDKRTCVWEQELYNHFEYKYPCTFFHSFEAENCMTGLNFADNDEANTFATAVIKILQNREQKRQEKKRSQITRPTNAGIIVASQGRSESMPSLNHREEKHKGKKLKKLTKGDIGHPTDFRHMQHVGWSAETGFEMSANIDEDLKGFFSLAGVSDKDLNDNETRKFIYDFINGHGGIEKAKQEMLTARSNPPQPSLPPVREAPPTPRNHRGSPSLRTAAPPPPPSVSPVPNRQHNAYSGSPTRMPLMSSARGPPPPRPPPAMNDHHQMTSAPPPPPPPPSFAANNCAPAPPPPPPPPPSFTGGGSMTTAPPPPPPPLPGAGGGGSSLPPEPPDVRSALLDQIRKGKTLHHVEVNVNGNATNNSDDARGALLNQIRKGIELKPVAEESKSSATPMQGLAGALAKALQERSRVIQPTDESDSDDDEDNEDDEWED